jgi:hypothetical protein
VLKWLLGAILGVVTMLTPGTGLAGTKTNLQVARAFVLAHGCGSSDELLCGRSEGCASLSTAMSNSMWVESESFNALFGNCRAVDGRHQRVWFFVGRRVVGVDSPTSSREIVGLWRDSDTIAFLYVLYRRDDSNCCPSGGGAIVRFQWNGRRVVALDPMPPHQDFSIPLGR